MINRNRRRRRSKLTYLLVIALPALVLSVGLARRNTPLRDCKSVLIDGHQAHVVIVDRRKGETIRPVLAPAPGMDFQRLVDKWKPRAAINGGYFDCDNKPIGDVVAGGKLLARGYQRSAVAVTDSGRVRFRRRAGRTPFRWAGYSAGLAAGPMLVWAGKSVVGSKRDGFSRSLHASRSAVGVTADGKLLMVVVQDGVTLEEMARIMLKIGAADAMNLDGGGSCGLYGDGKMIVRPYARMSTVLIVTATSRLR
jgi:exopolysaccharide biosynthesis protein